MTNIRLPSGTVTDNPDEIKSHVREFYRTLYSNVPTDESARDALFSDLPKLDPQDSEDLDNLLTPDELDLAVKQLSNNKAPGLDGLSCEFFQHFWPLLKNDLLSVFNHAITSGNLPQSFQRSIISLIPKKGDLSDIANWRPISLLNTDYKLFAKLLANRLKQYIECIIHYDQSYCVPGRSIYDNILLVKDIINYSNFNDTPLAVLNLDQKKAFDNVDHGYLFDTMRVMGFGDRFIYYVKLLYNKCREPPQSRRFTHCPLPCRERYSSGLSPLGTVVLYRN